MPATTFRPTSLARFLAASAITVVATAGLLVIPATPVAAGPADHPVAPVPLPGGALDPLVRPGTDTGTPLTGAPLAVEAAAAGLLGVVGLTGLRRRAAGSKVPRSVTKVPERSTCRGHGR
jgi:hypothetical protein